MTRIEDDWGDEPEQPELSWLTLQDAVDCIAAISKNGYVTAKENLFALISDGRLKMKCDATCEDSGSGEFDWVYRPIRIKHRVEVTTPGRSGVGSLRRAASPKSLKPDFWRRAHGWIIDADRTDFSSGLIVGTKPAVKTNNGTLGATKPAARRAAIGVLIEQDPACFPDLAVGTSTQQPVGQGLDVSDNITDSKSQEPMIRTNRRGVTKSDLWQPWFAEVVVYVQANGLNTNMTAKEFNELINNRIFERNSKQECLDLSTVEKTIGTMMARWDEARRKGEID
jgi:hypothetical protein